MWSRSLAQCLANYRCSVIGVRVRAEGRTFHVYQVGETQIDHSAPYGDLEEALPWLVLLVRTEEARETSGSAVSDPWFPVVGA